ncbi:MAG: hypothetical protein AAB652_01505 [Patescibacteria group bacterium]
MYKNNKDIEFIAQALRESSLSKEDQDDFLLFCFMTPKSEREPLIALIQDDPSWIQKLSINYKAKKQAIRDRNSDLLDAIVQEEQTMLSEIEQRG